jgi:hypothetical protein
VLRHRDARRLKTRQSMAPHAHPKNDPRHRMVGFEL